MNIAGTQSSNPALSKKIFQDMAGKGAETTMTLQGTINKTFLGFLLVMAGAVYTWTRFSNAASAAEGMTLVTPYLIGGAVGGFILALITVFKKQWAGYTVPIYSVLEGLFLGALSAIIEAQFEGESIVLRAVMLTMGTFFLMLFLYRSQIIKVTNKLRLGIVAATGGVALVYILGWMLSIFGIHLEFLYGNSLLSIGVSLLVIGIAAFNLLLDFDFIDRASKMNVPKYMEWYGAFGLLVTLIWLYLEILRLLSKLASRD